MARSCGADRPLALDVGQLGPCQGLGGWAARVSPELDRLQLAAHRPGLTSNSQARTLMHKPWRCKGRRSIQISSDRMEAPPGLGGSNTTEHPRGDFPSDHVSRSSIAPKACALLVIRSAHYSCSATESPPSANRQQNGWGALGPFVLVTSDLCSD